MRLAIADPPYLGRAARNYGPGSDLSGFGQGNNNLRHYLAWVPNDTRVCAWHKPRSVPTGSRITPSWEPVLAYVPHGRRGRGSLQMTDVLTAPPPQTFVGAKPSRWTRWVLDLLGYSEGDTVDDLFPGSGAVERELAQGVLT